MEPRAYGNWPSQISAEQLVAQSLRLNEPRIDGDYVYWLESRPLEKGRTCITRAKANSAPEDVLPYPISAQSKANEYGGGCYCVYEGVVFFVQADDQRIYRLDAHSEQSIPVAITPEGEFHYADLVYDIPRQRLIAVKEDHSNPNLEPIASIVSIDIDGRDSFTLVDGDDFYSSPQISPCGSYLCWLSWNHPAMPWTNNACFAAVLNEYGGLTEKVAIAGSAADQPEQAIFQPQWSANSELYLVSDRDNWWRLYRVEYDGSAPPSLQPVMPAPPAFAEFGQPHWVFGQSTWGFLDERTILASFTRNGTSHLCSVDIEDGNWQELATPWTDISALTVSHGVAALLGANSRQGPTLTFWHVGLAFDQWQTVTTAGAALDASTLSQPEPISFGPIHELAHGFYYPPFNGKHCGLADEKPPLIVLAHGGPTAQSVTALNIKIQYWCSRGFAVVDVNYRGSTGYGRDYRLALNDQWGISDVVDVSNAARYLVERNLADPDRVAIKGSSAGGYTVLAALTFTDTFKAGASLYGIGDLETLVQDTHKFESRYLDSLVGPYPQCREIYHARSPIYHVEQLNCPVIFFQGDQDKVVPPNQAQAMVNALKRKGIPVAHIVFRGEGHGFRQAENIVRAIESELYFYSKIFGFEPADAISPVTIENFSG